MAPFDGAESFLDRFTKHPIRTLLLLVIVGVGIYAAEFIKKRAETDAAKIDQSANRPSTTKEEPPPAKVAIEEPSTGRSLTRIVAVRGTSENVNISIQEDRRRGCGA